MQGFLLSPVLFNVYTADWRVITYIKKWIDVLKKILTTFNDWCKNHNISISLKKCYFIIFRKTKSCKNYSNLNVEGTDISWKNECKYMNVTLTSNFNRNQHINVRKDKVFKGVNIIRTLCGTWWSADTAKLLIIYRHF